MALPTLVWPREIPIDGTPADVVTRVEAYDATAGLVASAVSW